MKKTILAVSVSLFLAACVGGCGGGGTDTITVPVKPPAAVGVECKEVTNASFLNNQPVYSFGGLLSNWSNGDSVPGKLDGERFSWAVSNYAAIANERNDAALKSQVVGSVFNWANARAYEGTRWCWTASNGWDNACTQWVDPNGNDLSAIQDNNYVMERVQGIRRAYGLLSPWAKVNEPTKHAKIMEWFNYWDSKYETPSRVFFGLGMGRYHWAMQRVAETQGSAATADLANRLLTGIQSLVNDDGSIIDRTTRGNRALWYHYTSLNEIMTSVHLARQAGVTVSPAMEVKLHKTVELFLNTLDNPTYIVTWAGTGYNNGGDGRTQNFDFAGWYNDPYAGSWIYLYANWYPNHANTTRLRQKAPLNDARSASMDAQFGVPLGCTLY